MAIGFEGIIYYLVLLDAIIANILAFFKPGWMKKNYRGFAKHFPVTRGWTLAYLVLVLWLGWALNRLGLLGL